MLNVAVDESLISETRASEPITVNSPPNNLAFIVQAIFSLVHPSKEGFIPVFLFLKVIHYGVSRTETYCKTCTTNAIIIILDSFDSIPARAQFGGTHKFGKLTIFIFMTE
jgi:hypothetical protein